jgi:two-component system phosphate regulon sensor histidine kinase PhoR
MEPPFELNSSLTRLVDRIDWPIVIVSGERVALANPAARGLLGSHIVGQDVRLAIRHPEAVSLVSSGGEGSVTIRGLTSPTNIWEVTVQPLGTGWRLIGLRDLSAQADISRAHTDFVANASHELRTPLAVILGYVETLIEPHAGGDPATRDRFLRIVEREARRLEQLVEDLMSLSRIEAVKHDRPDEAVDLASIARQVVADINNAHDGRPVAWAEALIEPVEIAGDAGQLAQLVRNLVENALRHGASDAPVLVEVGLSGNQANITITDKGAGIGAEHIPRLTERFYRVDAGRSRDAGGTGLGLAIVKHIVERHRGNLDIESQPGEGTRVNATFPVLVIKESQN